MGFDRQPQPQALPRAAVVRFVAEELAFETRCADPFGIAHDCRNPAGHHFIASCGDVVCIHCTRIAWS